MNTVKKGARIAIFSETRYEWYTSYLATTNGTGCVVPLDKELPVDDVLNMLTRAEVDILLFSKSKLSIVNQVYGKVDNCKHWIWTALRSVRRSLLKATRSLLKLPSTLKR